jgi:hypothetical protein
MSGAIDNPSLVFDSSHYAATFSRKLWRALELGPKYYFWDLPRYFAHRRRRGLPTVDLGSLFNPLREFRCAPPQGELPPGYKDALQQFADLRIVLTIPQRRLDALLAVWWTTRRAAGDDIECGSYRGATGLLLAWLAQRNGLRRRIHLLDTFEGMPETSEYDAGREAGEFRPPERQVELIEQQACSLGVADRVVVHAGFFADTFAEMKTTNPRFAFAHIDANIYSGTREACEFCIPRVSGDGAVVFDDYNGVCDLGARLAIDESLRQSRFKPRALCASSAFIRIPRRESP